MNLRTIYLCILLGVFLTAASTAVRPDQIDTIPDQIGGTTGPDWLSPRADTADWDPYAPSGYAVHLTSASPTGISIRDGVLSPNQIYLQSDGQLTDSGTVGLGEPYTIWLYVAEWGHFALYDRGRTIVSTSFIYPGWYRLDRYAEVLESHLYAFNVSTYSNEVSVRVSPNGYPTSYSLVGRVVDQTGVGIPGAAVKISGSEGGLFSTTTDNLGFYGMNLPTGVYSVTADLEGYSFTTASARLWSGTASVAETVVGHPLLWTNTGTGLLVGKVVDKNGRGISGAMVVSDGFSATTNTSGDYQMALSPGWHTIDVEMTDYLFRSVSIQIDTGQIIHQDLTGRAVLALGSG